MKAWESLRATLQDVEAAPERTVLATFQPSLPAPASTPRAAWKKMLQKEVPLHILKSCRVLATTQDAATRAARAELALTAATCLLDAARHAATAGWLSSSSNLSAAFLKQVEQSGILPVLPGLLMYLTQQLQAAAVACSRSNRAGSTAAASSAVATPGAAGGAGATQPGPAAAAAAAAAEADASARLSLAQAVRAAQTAALAVLALWVRCKPQIKPPAEVVAAAASLHLVMMQYLDVSVQQAPQPVQFSGDQLELLSSWSRLPLLTEGLVLVLAACEDPLQGHLLRTGFLRCWCWGLALLAMMPGVKGPGGGSNASAAACASSSKGRSSTSKQQHQQAAPASSKPSGSGSLPKPGQPAGSCAAREVPRPVRKLLQRLGCSDSLVAVVSSYPNGTDLATLLPTHARYYEQFCVATNTNTRDSQPQPQLLSQVQQQLRQQMQLQLQLSMPIPATLLQLAVDLSPDCAEYDDVCYYASTGALQAREHCVQLLEGLQELQASNSEPEHSPHQRQQQKQQQQALVQRLQRDLQPGHGQEAPGQRQLGRSCHGGDAAAVGVDDCEQVTGILSDELPPGVLVDLQQLLCQLLTTTVQRRRSMLSGSTTMQPAPAAPSSSSSSSEERPCMAGNCSLGLLLVSHTLLSHQVWHLEPAGSIVPAADADAADAVAAPAETAAALPELRCSVSGQVCAVLEDYLRLEIEAAQGSGPAAIGALAENGGVHNVHDFGIIHDAEVWQLGPLVDPVLAAGGPHSAQAPQLLGLLCVLLKLSATLQQHLQQQQAAPDATHAQQLRDGCLMAVHQAALAVLEAGSSSTAGTAAAAPGGPPAAAAPTGASSAGGATAAAAAAGTSSAEGETAAAAAAAAGASSAEGETAGNVDAAASSAGGETAGSVDAAAALPWLGLVGRCCLQWAACLQLILGDCDEPAAAGAQAAAVASSAAAAPGTGESATQAGKARVTGAQREALTDACVELGRPLAHMQHTCETWLSGNAQQLAAWGYDPQGLLQQLEPFAACPGTEILQIVLQSVGELMTTADRQAGVMDLVQALLAAGQGLTLLANPSVCNNPGCRNVAGPSEAQLVGGAAACALRA